MSIVQEVMVQLSTGKEQKFVLPLKFFYRLLNVPLTFRILINSLLCVSWSLETPVHNKILVDLSNCSTGRLGVLNNCCVLSVSFDIDYSGIL